MSHETNKQLLRVTRELAAEKGLPTGPSPLRPAKVLMAAIFFGLIAGLLFWWLVAETAGQSAMQDKAQWEAITDLREKQTALATDHAALAAKVESNDKLLWWVMGVTGVSGATAFQVARRTIERRKERMAKGEGET